VALIAQIEQRREAGVGLENHVAAAATVPPGRSTARNVRLTAEGHTAISAIASSN
jgi:hypothetical protein